VHPVLKLKGAVIWNTVLHLVLRRSVMLKKAVLEDTNLLSELITTISTE